MRPRVFVTQPVDPDALARLAAVSEVDVNRDPLHIVTKDELLAAVRTHDILFCLLHDRVDADVIRANPKLRAVATMTITPADIDVAAATARRIPVTTVPAPLLADATADLTFALLLAVARRVAEGDRLVRGGTVLGSQSNYLVGSGVSGKVLGLVGAGRIGQAMACRATGFGMRCLYHDPRRLPAEEERALGLTWTSLDELLGDADFVSVHAALTPQTRHMIGARELGLMKSSAYLINTARGPLIDEPALIVALIEGHIAGAGLDVFENEPHVAPALRNLPNVVISPHVGSATREVRAAMANAVVDNILAVLDGRQPPNCWNPEIYAASA